jgi:hypothetical protein
MFGRTLITYRSMGSLAVFVSMNVVWGSVSLAQQQVTRPERQTGGVLLVVNDRHHSLLEVDPITGQVEATIPIGVNGHEITLSTDQRHGWIPIYGDAVIGEPGTDGSTIDVVDLYTRQVNTIDLGRPLRPHLGIFGPDGLFYVTAELANAVLIVESAKKDRGWRDPDGQATNARAGAFAGWAEGVHRKRRFRNGQRFRHTASQAPQRDSAHQASAAYRHIE